jgi:hypothetical protein
MQFDNFAKHLGESSFTVSKAAAVLCTIAAQAVQLDEVSTTSRSISAHTGASHPQDFNILLTMHCLPFDAKYCRSIQPIIPIAITSTGASCAGAMNKTALSACTPQITILSSSTGLSLAACTCACHTEAQNRSMYMYRTADHRIHSNKCLETVTQKVEIRRLVSDKTD